MSKENNLTKVELAKLQKRNELLSAKLKEIYVNQPIPKDKLAEVYDPDDPTKTTDFINKHKATLEEQFNTVIADIDNTTTKYVDENFDTSKLLLEDVVSKWADSNNLKDVDVDKLYDNVPPVITKKFKDAKTAEEINSVLEEAKVFVQPQDGQSGTTLPHNHTGNAGSTSTATNTDEDDSDDIY